MERIQRSSDRPLAPIVSIGVHAGSDRLVTFSNRQIGIIKRENDAWKVHSINGIGDNGLVCEFMSPSAPLLLQLFRHDNSLTATVTSLDAKTIRKFSVDLKFKDHIAVAELLNGNIVLMSDIGTPA